MTLKTIGHLVYITSSIVHHFKAIGEFKLGLQSGNAQFGSKWAILFPCNLEIWQMTLKNNRVHLLYGLKLCASFHSHQWIQTWATVRKPPIWVEIDYSFVSCNHQIWQMTQKNNRAPLLCYVKLLVNLNWGYSPETHNWGQNQRFLSRVTLKFHGWPWKKLGRLSWATSSFVNYFINICEF